MMEKKRLHKIGRVSAEEARAFIDKYRRAFPTAAWPAWLRNPLSTLRRTLGWRSGTSSASLVAHKLLRAYTAVARLDGQERNRSHRSRAGGTGHRV